MSCQRVRRASFACLLGVLFSPCAEHQARGDEVEFLSDRPAVVFSIDMAAIFKSKLSQQVGFNKTDKTVVHQIVGGLSGIPLENVARITGSVCPIPTDGVVFVIKPAKAISSSDIMAARNAKDLNVKEVGSHKIYYRDPHPFGFGLDAITPFCVISDKVVLCGNLKGIERSLQRKNKPEFDPQIQEGLDQVGFAHTIMVVVDLQAFVPRFKKEAREGKEPVVPQRLLDVSDHFGTLTMRVDLGETNKISMTMFCKDAASAAAVRKCAEEGLTLWKAAVNGDPQAEPGVKEFIKALRTFADAVKISTKGSRVEAEATLDFQTAVSLIAPLGPIGSTGQPPTKEK
jgi:hypothetical protein